MFFFNGPATPEIYTDGHTVPLTDALPISVERCLHQPLAPGVERRGRLVEQQDRRITQQRARDRDPLALPARQPRPAFTEEGIEPLRQCAQEIGGDRKSVV